MPLLADEGEIEILEAADAEDGQCVFIVERPDLCIIDINLPTVSRFELARRILERAPEAPIIMFSMNDDPGLCRARDRMRRQGYVSKTGDPDDLVEAIRAIGSGGTYLPSAIARNIAFAGPTLAQSPLSKLNPARDGDPAAARRRQEPVGDRLAGAIVLRRRSPTPRPSCARSSG